MAYSIQRAARVSVSDTVPHWATNSGVKSDVLVKAWAFAPIRINSFTLTGSSDLTNFPLNELVKVIF